MTLTRVEREVVLPTFRSEPEPTRYSAFARTFRAGRLPSWAVWERTGCCTPHADILELDDQYLLEIALPGVVLDDIELKVEENVLTVIAKRTPAMFEERAYVLRKELPAGYMVRHFEFDTPILPEEVQARMDRGILFVSVPKEEGAISIPVDAGAIESYIPSMKTRVGHKAGRSPRPKESK